MRRSSARSRLRTFLIVAALCWPLTPSPVSAQSSVTMVDFAAGSDYEQYLRAIQIAGIAPPYPWSIRSFSRQEVERLVSADSAGPWKLKNRFSQRDLSASA